MAATPQTFVGFGFGAIQSGLFLYEAFRSGNFQRLVVAEIVSRTVEAVRRAGGVYRVNIATRSGIETVEVRGVEIFNPAVSEDARSLAAALAEASEIATALPSVEFYDRGEPSVARLLAGAIEEKLRHTDLPSCVIYTAENHNHAAEILEGLCHHHRQGSGSRAGLAVQGSRRVQFLNTVIGKMSGVVSGAGLASLAPDLPQAFLVEEFNRILISRITLPDFRRGITVFVEKPDLVPFEEAKLYGHNAVHALLGFLARRKGYELMSEVGRDAQLMNLGRDAFLEESGAPLIARHGGLDPLFTPAGYRAYAEDLLERMTNPHLRDRVERVIRDPRRKLGWEDRLVGTMRLALDAGVRPWRFALGVAAALETIAGGEDARATLAELWPGRDEPPGRKAELCDLVVEAQHKLQSEFS
jgi:mannitol-1-phosphate 5-dehydrogenase